AGRGGHADPRVGCHEVTIVRMVERHRFIPPNIALCHRRALVALLLCAPLLAAAQMPDLPKQRGVPGGVVAVPLGAAPSRPLAHVNHVPLMVLGDSGNWVALVGIPLSAKPGAAALQMRRAAGQPDVNVPYAIE